MAIARVLCSACSGSHILLGLRCILQVKRLSLFLIVPTACNFRDMGHIVQELQSLLNAPGLEELLSRLLQGINPLSGVAVGFSEFLLCPVLEGVFPSQ